MSCATPTSVVSANATGGSGSAITTYAWAATAGGAISGATNAATASATAAGTYNITVTDANSCTNSGSIGVTGSAGPCTVIVNAKVYLGTVVGSTMPTSLVSNLIAAGSGGPSVFPLSNPYAVAPLSTSGNFTAVNGGTSVIAGANRAAQESTLTTNNIVDWVFLELRTGTTTATTVVATRAALIKSNGSIVDMNGTSPVTFNAAPGNYYIAIKHRNHVGFRTNAAIALSATTSSLKDFTISDPLAVGYVPTYGIDAMQNKGVSVQSMWPGEGVIDGFVDTDDFLQFGAFNSAVTDEYHQFDFNLDGSVDTDDYFLFVQSNGIAVQLID